MQFIHFQAVDDVNKGFIKTGDKLYDLKALKESENSLEVKNTISLKVKIFNYFTAHLYCKV